MLYKSPKKSTSKTAENYASCIRKSHEFCFRFQTVLLRSKPNHKNAIPYFLDECRPLHIQHETFQYVINIWEAGYYLNLLNVCNHARWQSVN